jgi:prephenate dehydrogenase
MHVTVIGTGLIGCSLGLTLRKAGHFVTGVDKNEIHLQEALGRGALDNVGTLENTIRKTDLVALCIPVDAILSALPEILNNIAPHTAVMDMGSTKLDICNLADKHPRRENFVAVHPMAGVEHSGPGAAHVDMFLHARVLICNPQDSSTEALNKVLGILQELKMKVIFMDALDHDRQLALVSHLPQFMAYALSSMEEFDLNTHKNWTELGGGGLQSSIRLGKSDANMWMPVFQQNKENLLQFIDSYMHQLTEMRRMIENNQNGELNELIKKANANYEKLNYHNNKPRPLVPNQGAPKVFYS